MSQALYRKYRPSKWSEAIGQEHIIKVLKGSIENKSISHAYLFAGSRGTGKTTFARIFAAELGASNRDIYEIDAASNRGVDDARALREGVSTMPYESKYKVYIIDEVHMLTKEAFNSLLKTLEEPPSHVVFILATTEVEKLPETVISRCQTFTFKKPTHEMLKKMVIAVSKKEAIDLEPASADLIALLGDSSFRDTLGVLQKVLSFSRDKKITVEEVEQVTGAPKSELVNSFIKCLGHSSGEALKKIKEAVFQGIDMSIFMRLVLEKVRFILLLRLAADMENDIRFSCTDRDFVFLTEQAHDKNSRINASVLLLLINASEQIDRCYISELPIEIAIMKMSE